MGRWEINTTKYLRDLFDSNDGVSLPYYKLIEGIYAFLNGTGNNMKDEPWAIGYVWKDDFDGRSTRDYRTLIDAANGISPTDSAFLYGANCNPVGD